MAEANLLEQLEEKGKELRSNIDLGDLRWKLDKLRYHARHFSLVLALTPGLRLWHFMLNPFYRLTSLPAMVALNKRIIELLERDLENAEKGYYPKELLFEFFDETVPQYMGMLREGLSDIPNIILRKARGKYNDLPQGMNLDDYPAYYRRNFHWQTDGWFSDHSARIYDGGVEFLFGGTADVMRRMIISPVADAVRGMDEPKILDVACGTGRFLHMLHKALPDAKLSGLDLSPNYIEHARAEVLSGDGDIKLYADNAEKMPLKKDSYDAATCIFLFHELPSDVRRTVMKDVWRVLKPGCKFVVLDSAQLSESSAIKIFLEAFPVLYHEPYYKGYLSDDIEDIMEESGFSVEESMPQFVSKMVVGRKPARTRSVKKH